MSELEPPPRLVDDEGDELGALFRAGREVPEERLLEVGARLVARPLWMKPWAWGVGLLVLGVSIGASIIDQTSPTVERSTAQSAPPSPTTSQTPVPERTAAHEETNAPQETPVASDSVRPPRNRRARARDRATPSGPETPVAEPSVAPIDTPAPSEYELIFAARRAVRSGTAPSRARAALEEHERIYPEGALREERESLRVELLWVTGDRSAAEMARRRFDRAFPTSAHRARLEDVMNSP